MQELWLHHKEFLLDRASTNSQAENAVLMLCVHKVVCNFLPLFLAALQSICKSTLCPSNWNCPSNQTFPKSTSLQQKLFITGIWVRLNFQAEILGLLSGIWTTSGSQSEHWKQKIKYCPQNVTTQTWLRLTDFVILSVIVSFGYFLTWS